MVGAGVRRKKGASTTELMATGAESTTVEEAGKAAGVKSRTQRIMDGMPSSKQAMGAGGSSTYQVRTRFY